MVVQRLASAGNFSRHKLLINRKKTLMALSAATAFAGWTASSHADTFGNIWATDGNLTTLNSAAAWTDETGAHTGPPASGDIAQFDTGTGLTATTTFTLGVPTTWMGLSVTTPGAAIVIGGTGDNTNTLTLGASGVDMSAANQNVTISDPLAFNTTATVNVATGEIFTQSTTSTIAGDLTVTGAGSATFTGALTGGANNIVMNGTGTMTLTAVNSYSGNTTVNSGLVSFGANTTGAGGATSAGTGTLFLNGGTVAFHGSSSMNNGFYNPLVVEANGGTITGGTQFAGAVTGSGQLNVAIGSGSNLVFIGPTTEFNGYNGLIEMGSSAGMLGFGSGNANGGAGVGLDLGTSTGFFTTQSDGTYTFASLAGGSGTQFEGSRKTNGPDTYSIGTTGVSTVFAGVIRNGTSNATLSTTALVLTGGTLTLTGANTYTGGTTINAGATLQIGSNTASGTLGTAAVAVTNNSTLIFNRSDNALSESNSIIGSGNLINAGTGTVTLSGINSYSNGTTISAGLLQADNATNALGSTTVNVNSGGAVGGIGNIMAPVSIASGGTLSPGDVGISHGSGVGVGSLSVSSLALAAGSILNYDFSPASNDLTNITTANALTVAGGGINLFQAGTTNAFDTNGIYDIFQFPSPYTGGSVTNLLNVLNAQGGVSYLWGTSGNFITLSVSGGGSSTSWNNTAGGNWATPGNWTAGVPSSVGASATLGTILAAPSTVSLGGSETVGSLVMNNSSGGAGTSYTVAQSTGTDTLVIDNGGPTATGSITVTGGNQLITAPLTLNSNLSLGVSISGSTLTISGAIGGAGSVADSSSGLVVLSGNNTYSGGTAIVSGVLQIGAGGASGSLGSSTAPIANGGSLAFDISSSLNVVNAIGGSGSVSMSGTGTVTLSGANTYGGNTTINAGTVQVGTNNPTALNSGKLVFGGPGVLDVNGNSISLANITGSVGTIDNVSAGGTPTLTFNNSSSPTFGGVIINTTGSLALVKANTGTLSLSGVNTYSGGTTISAGAVKALSTGNLGSGPISVVANSGLQLGSGAVVSNAIVLNNGSSGEFEDVPDAGATGTLSGPITIGSVASGQQMRVGTSPVNATTGLPNSTLVLTGAATVHGSLTLFTRGNVVYSGTGSLLSTNTVVLGRSSNTAVLNLTIENSASIAGQGIQVDGIDNTSDDLEANITIQDNGSLSSGAGIFNLNDSKNANSSTEVTIAMSGNANLTAGSFTELSSGTGLTTFTVNGGTLTAGASDPAGGQWLPSITNGDGPMLLQIDTNGVTVNNAGFHITIAQPFSDGGGFVNFTGTGSTTLAVGSSYAGNDALSGGTLVIADNSGTATGSGNLTLLTGAVLASSPTGGGTISGNVIASAGANTVAPGGIGAVGTLAVGGLTTTSASTLNFDLGSGAGPLITNGDILTLGANSASIASGTMLSFAGTPVIGDTYELIGGNISGITNLANFVLPTPLSGQSYSLSNSGTFINLSVISGPTHASNIIWDDFSAGNLWDTSASVNWNASSLNTVFNAQDTVTFNDNNGSAAGRYAVTLNTTVSPASVTFNNSTSSYTVSGTGSIGGTGALTMLGTNTVTLSTSNSYSGGTSINAGVLNVGNSGALGTIGTVSFGGGTLQYSASNNVDYSSRFSTAASQAYNVDTNGVNVAWASALTSSGGTLSKAGAGTLTLSGPNSYAGGTTVSAGTLLIGQAGTNATFTGPALATPNTRTALPTGALTISGAAVVQLADGVTNQTYVTPGAGSSVVTSNINLTSLSLTGTGTLDIGNNRILIDYTTGNDPIATIEQWIANGFTDGDVAGALPAIISSDIATDDSLSGLSYGIGYADGADGLIAGLPSGEIEIMYTLVGDANLDGTVNSEDFTPFSNNLNGSGRTWDQGDFNYDGTVNSEDFTPFSHDLNQSATLAASETGPLASSLVSNGISLTNVPEPATMGLMVAAGLGILSRRRRSARN